jgi:uncharacterized protein with ParB-like and HNH nuclease domain
MKEIRGDAKSVRALLSGAKYAIDYYQREYRWQTKQITELLDDLADKFRECYDEGHERSAVETYGHYFLGSIIISDRDGEKYVIDGQQRLTSLTLLLIFLHRHLPDTEQQSQLAELIFSKKYGKKSFNLNVDDRTACMDALFAGQPYDEIDQPESVVNILQRYDDIEEQFPEDLSGNALPYFADWLIENVRLVEITAYSDDDAYTIFETMNDRGLSLTPTDMLKGYLLANIADPELRTRANTVWKNRIAELQELGKEEDADAIKAWLRSQYADSIRERKRGASPKDFDLIGTEFHRWVRDHEQALGLKSSADFCRFIEKDFAYYTRQYLRIRRASEELTAGLERIFYNAQNKFTLQFTVLLSPLKATDSETEALRKLRVTAAFIDILTARRVWNFRAIDYSTMQYAMFLVLKDIRGKSAVEAADILMKRLAAETENFSTQDRFRLHGMNRRLIHRLLARMTAYIETNSGMVSHYCEYVSGKGKKAYEVEHIWANHPEQHADEFAHPSDFDDVRNRIGGLLLLPKSFNASYGDLPYMDETEPTKGKLEHYLKQNLLAMSLHPLCYQHNPGFKNFLDDSGLPFRPHAEFTKSDLEARSLLYRRLAERIWNHEELLREATSD